MLDVFGPKMHHASTGQSAAHVEQVASKKIALGGSPTNVYHSPVPDFMERAGNTLFSCMVRGTSSISQPTTVWLHGNAGYTKKNWPILGAPSMKGSVLTVAVGEKFF